MSNKLYVGNIPFKATEEDLREVFAPFGELTDIYIAKDRRNGRPRGFAFVTYNTDEEAALAAEKMNGAEMGERPLIVNTARPKEESGKRDFGSNNRSRSGFGRRNHFSRNRKRGGFSHRRAPEDIN